MRCGQLVIHSPRVQITSRSHALLLPLLLLLLLLLFTQSTTRLTTDNYR
jgi:hypothetical protein